MDKHVEIPSENLIFKNGEFDNYQCVTQINQSLSKFNPKEIFPWNLEMVLKVENVVSTLLPSKEEFVKLESYRKKLELKFNPTIKPNALFVGLVCSVKSCRIYWRIHEADLVDIILKKELLNCTYEFSYRMDFDKAWNDVGALIDL